MCVYLEPLTLLFNIPFFRAHVLSQNMHVLDREQLSFL